MLHDFDEKHGGQSGDCNNKGIMSYGSIDHSGWSACSKSDFEHHYFSRKWGETGCLADISGELLCRINSTWDKIGKFV